MSDAAPPPGLQPVPGPPGVAAGSSSTSRTSSIGARAGEPACSGAHSGASTRACTTRDGSSAIILLSVAFALLLSGMIARGEAGGADARAYWAGVRIWINGGDPYHPTGPFLPYVYAPWMLPLFAPWAVLPWDVAWFVWRVGTILLLLWTIHWAYRRRPLTTAVIVAVLAFPFGANLDTGNINLQLTLMLWAANFTGPRLGGLLWALATWMKWIPALNWFILPRAGRSSGGSSGWRSRSSLSLVTLPLTIIQMQALFGFGARPIRLDYLVYAWSWVPWLYRRPDPFDFLRPATWRTLGRRAAGPARQTPPAAS